MNVPLSFNFPETSSNNDYNYCDQPGIPPEQSKSATGIIHNLHYGLGDNTVFPASEQKRLFLITVGKITRSFQVIIRPPSRKTVVPVTHFEASESR
jgi:hypothetical protein